MRTQKPACHTHAHLMLSSREHFGVSSRWHAQMELVLLIWLWSARWISLAMRVGHIIAAPLAVLSNSILIFLFLIVTICTNMKKNCHNFPFLPYPTIHVIPPRFAAPLYTALPSINCFTWGYLQNGFINIEKYEDFHSNSKKVNERRLAQTFILRGRSWCTGVCNG